MICPGFKASAFNYQFETAIVIDNVNRFMSQRYCLDEINYIMNNSKIKQADRKRQVTEMFESKSVVSMWGHHRTYRVVKVVFDKNPNTLKFTDDTGE